jgi:hypothetical protein
VREAEVYRYRPISLLAELLGEDGQQIGETHLRFARQEALHKLFVLHETQFQQGHQFERHEGLPADGPLDKDLGHLSDLALRDGLGKGSYEPSSNSAEGESAPLQASPAPA